MEFPVLLFGPIKVSLGKGLSQPLWCSWVADKNKERIAPCSQPICIVPPGAEWSVLVPPTKAAFVWGTDLFYGPFQSFPFFSFFSSPFPDPFSH